MVWYRATPDLNDHDQLRHDPMFAVALRKLSGLGADFGLVLTRSGEPIKGSLISAKLY